MARTASVTPKPVNPDVQRIIEAIARDMARQDHDREMAARTPAGEG